MSNFKTEQEEFWAGNFGDEYIGRNIQNNLLLQNIKFFDLLKQQLGEIESILEFGPNVGMNLKAIQKVWPTAEISGVEINEKAATELAKNKGINVYNDSILNFDITRQWNLTFTRTVLIHINPDELQQVYEKLYQASDKFILIVEYYNQTPTEISYRGHQSKLFKRDFAGEFLEKYPGTTLIDYGFIYHNDPSFNLFDDLSWFLIKK